MLIGQRLRDLREAKALTQGDIEKSTGLVRPYISRVENGHTIPSIETLEKWARALDMPLYQLMYEGEGPPKPLKLPSENDQGLWGSARRQAQSLNQLRHALSKMDEKHRDLLLGVAHLIARKSKSK